MGLGTFIIRRLILLIPTLIGITLLIFAIISMLSPQSRAALFVTNERQISDLDSIIELYHLNDPLYLQYFTWLQQVLSGNLGWSRTARKPVLTAMMEKFPRTAELVMISIPITIFVGVYLGVQSAVHRDTIIDHATRTLAIIGWSLPTFWLGILLLAIFFGGYGWFPPGSLGSQALNYVTSDKWTTYTGFYTIDGLLNGQPWITLDALQHLVLPTITLVTIQIALIIRIMRSSMLESLTKGYIITAKAKGLKNKEVINKHARRNALIPVVTVSGLIVAGMLTGVVITETIFNINGLGRWAASAALGPDVPSVLGFALFTCIVYVVANLVVDIIYAYLDPRIRLG